MKSVSSHVITTIKIEEDDTSPAFEVRSAGTDALFGRKVTKEDLDWADLVVVMEDRHERKIRSEFPEAAVE